MDFLKSLHLDDLPEQQTRMIQLMEQEPDYQLFPGIDACCACGKPKPDVDCDKCRRVLYCSDECKLQDSQPPTEDQDDQALGHATIICSLLQLCNDDEAVLERDTGSMTKQAISASLDRINSELQSYPATLANIVQEGPCFQDALYGSKRSVLTVHVIGASEAELWAEHPDRAVRDSVCKAYADACLELVEMHSLTGIQIVFCGLECPHGFDKRTAINAESELHMLTYNKSYDFNEIQQTLNSKPDVVVFFNPGFTCPDYEWQGTVESIPNGMPFLITTNTELEGIADTQYLLENQFIASLPPGLADVLGMDVGDGDDSDDAAGMDMKPTDTFFSVNPFAGMRIRQSGTMANDLFVKNRWMLGGVWGVAEQVTTTATAKRVKLSSGGNSKTSNPALI